MVKCFFVDVMNFFFGIFFFIKGEIILDIVKIYFVMGFDIFVICY